VFFVSGGSEAVESAIKLARQYAVATGQASRWKVISRYPSYHGSTLGALALTGYAPLTEPFVPMMREMPKVPAPRAYLDGLDAEDPATGAHYAAMLEERILAEGSGNRARLHRRAGRRRIDGGAGAAGRLHAGGARDLRPPRRASDP
jgi:adenosylmethionine-8-amino-7-oxononanoate aminotransferase